MRKELDKFFQMGHMFTIDIKTQLVVRRNKGMNVKI